MPGDTFPSVLLKTLEQTFMKRLTIVMVAFLAFLFVNFDVQAASALETSKVGGEICPTGTVYVTVNEAVQYRNDLCNKLGQWDIVRLADGGSMDGPGYDCKVRGEDTRSLGNALCKDLNIKVTNGDANCPAGFALATVAEAKSNEQSICNNSQVGTWYIMRLNNAGSMDGPGYDCKIRSEDTRGLGNSLCVESL